MFACDKNKDGKIDFEEFVSYLSDEWLYCYLLLTCDLNKI